MLTCNYETAFRLAMINVRLGKPTLLMGRYGVGKSTIGRAIADTLSARFIDIRMGMYDRVDFTGAPVVDMAKKKTVWFTPDMLPTENYPNEPIVLMLDEIGNAPPSVQGVGYQIALDRQCGDWRASPGTVIVAASNQKGGAANKIVEGLANRFSILYVVEDVPAWLAHATSINVHPLLTSFVTFQHRRNESVLALPQATGEDPFATPRSVMNIDTYLKDETISDHDLRILVASWCGEAWSTEFMGFRATYARLPSIASIIANPTSIPVPADGSLSWALAVGISGAMNATNVTPLATYLARLGAEYQKIAFDAAQERDPALAETRAYVEYSLRTQRS